MENKPNSNLIKILAAVIILVLIISFALQNNISTDVKMWFWTVKSPLILLFLMCFISGLLFAMLGLVPIYKHSKRKTKLIEELKKRVEFLEKEISSKG